MRRLFTTFVSSTFLDLRAERQRLVTTLLGQHCVPIGMEFFPSTGRSQWPIIKESIAAADFCVFVVAGRYGTISPEEGISWTHREFREAVALGKPIVGILHGSPGDLPADKCEATAKGKAALARFRDEIEAQTVCRYFRSDADLIESLSLCVGALRDEGQIEGWVPAGRDPVVLQEADFDRVYELIDVDWCFSPSQSVPGTWDGRYSSRRRLRANWSDGLAACTIDFTRDTDRQLPFNEQREPSLELTEWSRSEPGLIKLLSEPRKATGSTYARETTFSPALGPGEVADFTIGGLLPSYKYASCDDLAAATIGSKSGPRAYDWTSRNVAYPTRRLVVSVFLPLELDATPRGPMLGRDASRVDPALSHEAIRGGCYSCEIVERDGVEGYQMRLAVTAPRMRVRYRLGWDLPSRGPLLPRDGIALRPDPV